MKCRAEFKDLMRGECYRHYKNKRFMIKIIDKFRVGTTLKLIIEHVWIDELQVSLADSYSGSFWEWITEDTYLASRVKRKA